MIVSRRRPPAAVHPLATVHPSARPLPAVLPAYPPTSSRYRQGARSPRRPSTSGNRAPHRSSSSGLELRAVLLCRGPEPPPLGVAAEEQDGAEPSSYDMSFFVAAGWSSPAICDNFFLQDTAMAREMIRAREGGEAEVPLARISTMRCYAEHERIIRFTKIMNHMSKTVCIYPSSALLETCSEAKLGKPIYTETSGGRSMFKYRVQVKVGCCSDVECRDDVTATGFAFCELAEARESAALAAVDVLLCFHGIKTVLFNDLRFVDLWSSYNDLSENSKSTTAALARLISEISTLTDKIGESRSPFEAEKLRFDRVLENEDTSNILDFYHSELNRAYLLVSAGTRELYSPFSM